MGSGLGRAFCAFSGHFRDLFSEHFFVHFGAQNGAQNRPKNCFKISLFLSSLLGLFFEAS